jgi:diguanylate cyclase (GGDEF)-like protein
MMAEPSGHILVFTKKGMFGFDPPASPNRLPDVLPVRAANAATGGPQRISNGCAAPDGSLWFATRGVLRLHHDSWSLSSITGMAVKNKTWQGMACAPDGTLFLISRENEILHLTPRNGNLEARSILLPEDYRSLALVAILSGSDGVLWLGTDDGLLAWNGSSWRHLTQESGLIWNDVNSGGLSLAPDGAIWIGTSAGVGRLVHPEHMFDAVSLPLSLTNIRHGAKQLPVIEAALPWSRSSMSFEFAVPTVLNRSDLTFSYRIAQLDPAWLETRDASAHFASLAPGSYDFQVFARNRALNATSPITTFRFSILPPWWRTSWFYCLCGLALLGFIFLLYELRTRHLLHQRKTLEEEVRNRTLELEESRSELLAQATHDGLTGLMNRSAILNALAAELARAQREKIALTVVLADVDHFKRVNDTHGHLAGDTALRRFAEALFYSTRTYDLAGRYGGEEFLILLPGISSEQAAERLADLHISISSVAVHHQSRLFEITCSCGALSIDPGQANLEPDEALAGADRALYEAKAKGRDRVVHHVFSSEPVFKGI